MEIKCLTLFTRLTAMAILLAAEQLVADDTAANARQPNILFLFADDHAYEAIGAAGILDIDTPNLDKLAAAGTSFTHAYNMGSWSGAVCIASRTMLNTGRTLWHARDTDLAEHARNKRMWSQRMHEAGYRTWMTGKWHVPTDVTGLFDVTRNVRKGMPKDSPEGYNRPLDEAGYAAGWKPWEKQYGGYWEGGKHWSEVTADDGIAFLGEARKDKQPFFMYVSFNAPHDPRQAPKDYIDRYPLDRVQLPENFLPEYPHAQGVCGKNLRDERLLPYPRTEYAVKVNRQEYFALISHMDDQIGRILTALEDTGQAENTWIVFTADHGLAVGRHGLVGKQNMYDHSVRVPFLVAGPGVTAGVKITTPIYLQDIVPTTLELAGADLEGIEFSSFLSLLRASENPARQTDNTAIYGAYLDRQRMISQDGWKLIRYPKLGIDRLYHTASDPFEKIDLAEDPRQHAKLGELRTALQALGTDLGDPLD